MGITQQEFAEQLSVSQQTIARWESAKSPIPTKYIRDMAVFLGCSISALLEVDAQGRFLNEKKGKKERHESDALYGTLTVIFGSKDSRAWPISEGQRSFVLEQLEDRTGFEPRQSHHSWLNFETLDDRIVFVNPSVLESVNFIGDDLEPAPSYEHQEVYEAVSALFAHRPTDEDLGKEDSPYSRQLLEKCDALIETWGGVERAGDRMDLAHIERLDGSQENLMIEDDGVSDLVIALIDNNDKDPTYRFANLDSEGFGRASFYRYGALRLIEMSKSKWKKMIGD